MSIVHRPAGTSIEDAYGVLERDGCVVIDGLMAPQTIAAIRGEMDPWLDGAPMGKDEFDGLQTRRTGMLVARSPSSTLLRTSRSSTRMSKLASAEAMPARDGST